MKTEKYSLGIDIGSTTVKVVIVDSKFKTVVKGYHRHNARALETLLSILLSISSELHNKPLKISITGSGGLGLAQRLNWPFVQEVVAALETTNHFYPDVKTLIDVGGEDSKMVIIEPGRLPDIRMNGNCAGGTGAFIDQMAVLMGIPVSDLDELAKKSQNLYPIASRCGVFAKTDVQNLISRNVDTSDIAASIFHSVALQFVNALGRGIHKPELPLLFCGGPLFYLPALRNAFEKILHLEPGQSILPEISNVFSATGAAIMASKQDFELSFEEIINQLDVKKTVTHESPATLQPLFKDVSDKTNWQFTRQDQSFKIFQNNVTDASECYLGIDSGSTTTKIVLVNKNDQIIYSFYENNNGNPLNTVIKGLQQAYKQFTEKGLSISISGSCVTGYGEDLIKSALKMDNGLIETMAHFFAARRIDKDVSFILDIGGQDMKAIFTENGYIRQIEINEACSSGCGSFIEGFAKSLGYSRVDFASIACDSKSPCDLGTRCTVFMNSCVKQYLKEGREVSDIAAGLAYSVIKNCLYKVLRLHNFDSLGKNIVVQGGAFRNPAILRALELITGCQVRCSEAPEIMGAYGAALYAKEYKVKSKQTKSSFVGFENLTEAEKYTTKTLRCNACTNKCLVTMYKFNGESKFYSGNKCEKVFTNKGSDHKEGENYYQDKNSLLFSRQSKSGKLKIGIPRILNMYENYPFWHTLFTEAGFEVVLSDVSDTRVYEKGKGSIMSDNICFPAKLSHGHVIDLIDKGVDRLFFPFVLYEGSDFKKTDNSFNCPIVTGYSEVLKSSSEIVTNSGIPFDSPEISFKDRTLLKKAINQYLEHLGVQKKVIEKALNLALKEQANYKEKLRVRSTAIVQDSVINDKLLIVLAGRPYHADSLIQQKVSEIITSLGANVINEEYYADAHSDHFDEIFAVSQWAYPNRIMNAAKQVAQLPDNVQFVQLNSFGCGPDAFIIDEVNSIIKNSGKPFTLIRIDEIASPGSVRLRLRSLIESLKLRSDNKEKKQQAETRNAIYTKADRKKKIIAPFFSDFYSPFFPSLAHVAGYDFEILPKSDKLSEEYGLKYANNEVCFPAKLIVGDIMKAVFSGKYDLNNIAITMTQTGGQCRATNYLSVIKKALVSAGFANIPVISLATGDDVHNTQPGFDIKIKKIGKITAASLLFGDVLSQMYYATRPREIVKGSSESIKKYYLDKAQPFIKANNVEGAFNLLKEAVEAYNKVEIHNNPIPKIGIVGEIYVKFNGYGHFEVLNWLMEQGVEVVVPPLQDFIMQAFVNRKANHDLYLDKNSVISNIVANYLQKLANKYVDKANEIYSNFKLAEKGESIFEKAHNASKLVSLANQYGEGWLIPAEIYGFAEKGVNHVISLQPFGCIANHVISKGIEKKIKTKFPKMNLLFLDFDCGIGEVNVLNRLHFMINKVASKPVVNEEILVNNESYL